MVFPSLPLYQDPPNWSNQQQQAHRTGDIRPDGGGSNVHQLPPPAAAASRSVSMAERARLAKIPQPDAALRCPRCDSSNTKFCYFNNYSLTQPRHFCKTCRRYWTRGGALRNVPVGGGCRRNRRTKSSASSSSKSLPATAACSSSTATSDAPQPGNFLPVTPLPFFSSSPWQQHLQDLYVGGGGCSSSMGLEQWRIQQTQPFPFWGGSEVPYSFQGEGVPTTGSSQLGLLSLPPRQFIGTAPRSADDRSQQFIGLAPRSGDVSDQQFWSTAIANGHGGSSFLGSGSDGNGTVGGGGGGGGGGYMGIYDHLSGGFKPSSTARLS